MTQLQAILDALPAAVVMTDATGTVTAFNRAAAELAGRTPAIGVDRWCVAWRLYRSDGTPLPHEESPLAVALRERRAVGDAELIAERPDGTRVPLICHPSPLFDDAGNLTGAINVLTNMADRIRAEAESALLAAIVASSDDAIVSKTLEGRVTSWNASATRIFGYQEAEMIGESITRIIPPELLSEEDHIIDRLKRGERIEHFETTRVTKDGRRIDISLTVSPVRDKSGRVIGASKIARDITERKQAERDKELLIHELSHRVKNTLATVQAIASHTLRRAASPAEFGDTFSGRLHALARLHELLTQNTWQGAEVSDLVRTQVLMNGPDDERFVCAGPAVMLEPQTALHLALIVYELGTNARKYGALSVPSGRLNVEWDLISDGVPTLRLLWHESGGPAVSAPSARGFGTRLIEQSLQAHGGETTIHYDPAGLRCEISLPVPRRATTYEARKRMEAAARSAKGSPPPDVLLKDQQVLVVEDEPLVAMEIGEILAENGCKVVGPAGTYENAEALIEAAVFDVCLLDANLRGRAVDDLAEGLARRRVPFAFVTGYGRNGLPAGHRDRTLVNKPFKPEELVETVCELVRQSKLARRSDGAQPEA